MMPFHFRCLVLTSLVWLAGCDPLLYPPLPGYGAPQQPSVGTVYPAPPVYSAPVYSPPLFNPYDEWRLDRAEDRVREAEERARQAEERAREAEERAKRDEYERRPPSSTPTDDCGGEPCRRFKPRR